MVNLYKHHFATRFVLGFCVVVFWQPTLSQLNGQAAPDLRVMSFNIRYGTANDGANHWKHRKANVVATIQAFNADVIGLQETLAFQASYLKEQLPEFRYVGRSRESNLKGEQCGILVRAQRFDILEQGHFWLSETPNTPASKSWDSSLPRMATWVKLFDKPSKIVFYLVNTHFDHRGQVARERSAEVIVRRAARFESGVPVVLTGDFNTGPKSKPYQRLTSVFRDTFQTLHPDAKETGTFNGFKDRKDGTRIDFVFTSTTVEVKSASIETQTYEGRNPSDHFPVTAVLRLTVKE